MTSKPTEAMIAAGRAAYRATGRAMTSGRVTIDAVYLAMRALDPDFVKLAE